MRLNPPDKYCEDSKCYGVHGDEFESTICSRGIDFNCEKIDREFAVLFRNERNHILVLIY